MREAGFGLKAATITPEGKDDVGSPNRILREEVDGKVIVRTGRRIPGVVGPVSGVHHPISVVRMAVEDAYGAKQWREGDEGADDEQAFRTEKVTRSTCRAVAEYAFRTAERMGGETRVYGGPKWTVSPVYEGMLKEELDAAAERHPDVPYVPVLIDATYAGLLTGATETPLVIPALNRDGDCLSDLVLPMFGSIAGAESILLAFDDDYAVDVAMAEAPHGTAPSLHGQGPRQPDGDAAGLRRAAAVRRRQGPRRRRARLARDLRGRARDDRRRGQDDRPRRPHGHHRVHRRGRREDPHQGRHLVDARLALSPRTGPETGMQDRLQNGRSGGSAQSQIGLISGRGDPGNCGFRPTAVVAFRTHVPPADRIPPPAEALLRSTGARRRGHGAGVRHAG